MTIKHQRNQAGFTLIELTIAAVILATLLLLLTQIFIGIVRQDRLAISVQDATQNVRYAIDDITSNVRTAESVTVLPAPFLSTGINGIPIVNNDSHTFDQFCLEEGTDIIQYYSVQPWSTSSQYQQIIYKRVLPEGSPCCPIDRVTTNSFTPGTSTCVLTGGGGLATPDVAVVNDSNAPSGTQTGLNVVDFNAYTPPVTTTSPIPSLDIRIAMTTNLGDIERDPTGKHICQPGSQEYCSITSMETTISLRGAQSVGQ